jgi:predicted ferric reductase
MDHLRRGIAGLDALTPSSVLDIRGGGSTTGTGEAASTNTVAPYHTALNGVNQPMNLLFKDALWLTLGCMGVFFLLYRISENGWAFFRRISAMSMSAEKQRYWKMTQSTWTPWLKKHIIYAPLWRKRHNREFKLSTAVNVGTLPSRLQTIVLAIYVLSNVIYMFILNWKTENKYAFCAELRGRSGTLAVVNMVPLMLLATRNNPLIYMLKISFDTYNLVHRWLGRLVVIETAIHTVAWLIVQVADGGWQAVGDRIVSNLFIGSGMIGTVALILLLVFSIGPIRHAFYETFLNTHIVLAFIAFVCTWIHCVSAEIEGGLPQLSWIMGIAVLWFCERMARMLRLVYVNWSTKGLTEAIVEPMPGDTTRVTMHLPRYLDVKPGMHAYLRFWSVNPWECHPFSIAWVEHTTDRDALPITEKASAVIDPKHTSTSVSFIIGAQTGFTRKLHNTAKASGTRSLRLKAGIEGPYAGHHSLDSYGHVVLFAGSTGITHQISYIKHLIEGYADGIVATRRITLVWIVRDYEALEWVRPWMDTILRLPHRKDILRIQLFVTRPKNPREIVSASSTVQMFPGRPNIPLLLQKEVHGQTGAMSVTVCGPGALADDVRAAVRKVQDEQAVVDFVEESFTW